MTVKEKLLFKTTGILLNRIYGSVKKDPEKNIPRLIQRAERLMGNVFPRVNYAKFKAAVHDPENVYRRMAFNIINDVDEHIVKKMILAMGLGAGYFGTKAVRENREKYKCNIPWTILFDPTSACNLKCKGCWSAEYGGKQSLTNEDMESIVSQGVAMGTHNYMLTGGEPLIRKKDVVELCSRHPDCSFLIYTNATLIDKKFCDDIKRVGNIVPALSIEGSEDTNDLRRGEGSYRRSMKALELLKEEKCLYGISVCYTRQNIETVTSDEFLDLMVEKGAKFVLYFNYMPVGHGADTELIPTPAQRKAMYDRLRVIRNGKTGKPMFIMDFQNDGEYVGGCIAGGRNYFHVNSAGDIEPCVFIHFSDSNIHNDTLIEALKKPLFQAFWHNQPFNDNMLRPCPMLENPQYLRKIVGETGAKSTDLLEPEDAETVCARCDRYAQEWAPEADELWKTRKHPNPKTQYYRDTPEGRGCAGGCEGCAANCQNK